MNTDNLDLKKEFLKLFLDLVLANFTAIVVFVLVGK
ncbi:putative membrane protein, partial [Acinetobacter baumannii 1121032]